LSLKFTIYALLLPVVKDVIVNIFFGVFNILLTPGNYLDKRNYLNL